MHSFPCVRNFIYTHGREQMIYSNKCAVPLLSDRVLKFGQVISSISQRSWRGAAKCNGLPRDGPGFDSRWVRCINRASRPSRGTVNGDAVSK